MALENEMRDSKQINEDSTANKIDRIARQVEEMHRWFLGNGKVGLFEKIRQLSLQMKIVGLGMALLLLEAALTGRVGEIIRIGVELLR